MTALSPLPDEAARGRLRLADAAQQRARLRPERAPSGHADLFDEEAALALAYDGAHHRALHRQARDNVRGERLEAHGVTVLRATGLNLPDASTP